MASADDSDNEDPRPPRHVRTAYDIQRAKLEKLMKNPDRPVHIPQQRKEKDPNKATDFVYNVMGSSAGAGSGEFHVYRQIRRKEAIRQQALGEQKEKVELNEAFHQKLAENERIAEERTAKKRAKRQKKKQRTKSSKRTKNSSAEKDQLSSSSEEESERPEHADNKE